MVKVRGENSNKNMVKQTARSVEKTLKFAQENSQTLKGVRAGKSKIEK